MLTQLPRPHRRSHRPSHRPSHRRAHSPSLRLLAVAISSLALVLSTVPPAVPAVLGGSTDQVLGRETAEVPAPESSDGLLEGLHNADPAAGLAAVEAPRATADGGAHLSYPLLVPDGRGLTPEISLDYESGAPSTWVGHGWNLTMGDVSVDTAFGVPLFCPRTDVAPTCGDYESETYRLDGDLLAPTAVRTDLQPRVADRSDFTRKVETQYEHITRHGDSPQNYYWEVRDKQGNVSWYGGNPDAGGPFGGPGTRTGAAVDDAGRAPSAILSDDRGNAVKWYLKAQRDVGVNLVRYEYDTVHYRATAGDDGVVWTESDAGCTGVCGRHVYLSKILYTGAAEASGQPEAPSYEISFERGARRSDPVVDARGGFLDVDLEQLTRVEVRYLKSGSDETSKVVRYDLDTEVGEFGKTLLTAVHQTGCATGTSCSPGTRATHTFDYYDEVESGSGFAPPVVWDTRDDGIDSPFVDGEVGALGMSETDGGDGHVYVGFNPLTPLKNGSFGGSVSFEGSKTRSKVEFLDINGDLLPDKVFVDDSGVHYRLNTSRPGDPLDLAVAFQGGAAGDVTGLDKLPGESQFGITGGVEAFFGVSAMFNAGGSWNWSEGYFTDVNGDGLPDWVNNGQVLFNHLECGDDGCRPVFDESSAHTRVPLSIRPVDGAADDALAEVLAMLRRLSPPIDTLRRWTAPYDGIVTIEADASYPPLSGDPGTCATSGDGVRLGIQHNSDEIASCVLDGPDRHWPVTVPGLQVAKGDRLYFRVGPDVDEPSSTVEWHPTVTYTSFTGGAAPSPVPLDENGLDQTRWSSAGDFTLAGRPNAYVGMPEGGTVGYTGVLEKARTSDQVRPTIRHYRGSAPNALVDQPVTVTALAADLTADPARQKQVVQDGAQWCVQYPDGTRFDCLASQALAQRALQVLYPAETGLFGIAASFAVDAPVVDGDGAQTAQDRVELKLQVDSPVRVTALSWKRAPEMCYLAGGTCKEGSPRLDPPVDTDVYPLHSNVAPRVAWTAPADGVRRVRVGFSVVGNIFEEHPAATAWVTVKGTDGSLARHPVDVPANAFGGFSNAALEVPVKAGVGYWFDVTVREPAVFHLMRDGKVEISTGTDADGNTTWADVTNPHSAFNGTGWQGYFALPYRGWAMAGYRAEGDRRHEPVVEEDLRIPLSEDADDACEALTGGPCPTNNDHADFPDAYGDDYGPGGPGFDEESTQAQIRKAYAFLPQRTLNPSREVTEQVWTGPKQTMRGTATHLSASRLGEVIPGAPPAGGTVAPPTLKGQVAPSLAVTAGVGPLTGSFGVGWSKGDVDFLDMNGDQFPDVVRDGSIEFTDPRGGHACVQPGGGLAACSGGGVGALAEEFSLTAGGGLSGSPVKLDGNAKGRTNSTQGSQAGRGGQVSKDDYGDGVGAGLSVAASFTSPVVGTPAWDDGSAGEAGFDPGDFDDIPGDPVGSSGLQLQRHIADVNGDGLPDQVRTTTDGVFVRFNLGYGFTGDWLPWAPGSGFESGESYSGAAEVGIGFGGFFKDFSGGVSRNVAVDFPRYSWADVNGDGVLDALRKGSDDVRVGFGSGTGVRSGQVYGDTGAVPVSALPGLEVPLGDQIRQQSGLGWGGGFDFTISIGPLCIAACYLIVNPGAHYQKGQSVTDVELLDVNGDGFADSVTRDAAGGHEELLEVRLNEQGRTGLLRRVHNPLGGTTTLDYERRGNTVEHPEPLWVMSRVSVDDGRPGDGVDVLTATHEYGEPRYDFEHREHLGFDSVTSRDLAPGGAVLRTTRSTHANRTLWESGLEQRTEVYDGDPDAAGVLLRRTTHTWDVLDGPSQQPLDAAALSTDDRLKAWATPLLRQVHEESFEHGVGRATQTSYEYDRLGNATRVTDHGDLADPADDVVAEVEFSTCENAASAELAELCGAAAGPATYQPAFWNDQLCPTWTSLPAVLTLRDAAGTVLRHRDGRQDLCDNSSVTLLRELVDGTPADGTFAETILAYDDWGSYDRIVYPLGGNGRRYAVHYEYDEHRHSDVAEVQEYDLAESEVATFMDFEDPFGTPFAPAVDPAAKGLTSTATFDGRAGQVASSTDPNGHTTSYEYDALGRLSRTTVPDGGTAWFDYAPGAAYAHAVAHHSDEAHPGDPLDTVTFVDGLGRITQTKQETDVFRGVGQAPEHGFTVSGHLRHDALGHVVEETQPTFEPAGSATTFAPAVPGTPSTLTTWDRLDRPRSETLPGDRTTTIDYRLAVGLGTSLLEQDVTDPLGRRTVTSTDVRGDVRAVDDIAVGQAPLRTTITVDRLGQVLAVAQAGREQVRHTWDLLGRRTSTETEDGGLTSYGYDAYGRKVSEQTAVQRAAGDARTSYHYAFDRLVGVDFPDATPDVSYAWGGYLGAPTTDNGAGRIVGIQDAARRQTLGYDANGLLATESTEMVGDDWKLGRLTTTWDRDWLGRTLTIGYPDGETLSHGYDGGGTLDRVTGTKACTDVGRLTGPVDAVQTVIAVTEFPHEAPPSLPFTITVDGEQMLVTDRSATAAEGVFSYTVVRGTNGTAEAPTAAAHAAGTVVRTDAALTCDYRYLDRLEYDHFGAPAFRQVGNGNRTTYTPDPLTRRLARQVTVSPQQAGMEQQDLNYTYDKVGNVLTYVNDVPADVPSLFGGKVRQTYAYDGYYRLTSARGTWQEALNTRHFEYDVTLDAATGNTTAKRQKVWEVKVGCKKNCIDVIEDNTYAFTDVAFDPDHQHRLAVQGGEQFSFDDNGNVTAISSPDNLREMAWNAENKLTMIVDRPNGTGGKPTFLTYDHNGELAKEQKEQGRSWFVNPWVTVKDGTIWKNYFADDHRIGVKFSQDGYEQKVFFLHEDLLGGTHIATDRVGGIFQHQEYLPTGEPWVDEDSTVYRTPYQFSGEYTDEDHDLVDFGQRWFEPRGGIFYSADPLLYADPLALVDDPSYSSTFVLGGGNAVSNVDPDGWSHHNVSAKKKAKKAGLTPIGIATSKVQKKSTKAKAKKPKVGVLAVNPAAAQKVQLKPGFKPKPNRGGLPGSRSGKDFTAAGKNEVIMRAAAASPTGIPTCALCNVQVTVSMKSASGVTPLPTEVQVDHVFPSSKGGSGTVDNGQVLCRACNRAKSNK